MNELYIIPIFVPYFKNLKKSIFYNQKAKIDNKQISIEDIKKIIDTELLNVKDMDVEKEIAFLGNNFTAIDIEVQKELLELANEYLKEQKINGIRISTTPDSIDKSTLKLLKKYKVKTIELEALSTNDYILKKSDINYSIRDIKKASKMIKWKGFNLGYHIMVGLPESTRIDELNTAKTLIKLKPKIVRIYPAIVVKNSIIEKEFEKQKYEPLPLVQAVEICKELVRLFADNKVETIRAEEIDTKNNFQTKSNEDIIAGPFHPEFRQLVESAMWYDAIVEKIKKLNVKVKEVEVTVNPEDVDNVIGFNKSNVIKLKDTYDVDLIVKQEDEIKQGKSIIEITKTYNDFLEDD